MSGTLIPRRSTDMAPAWRNYWAERWSKLPEWNVQRLSHLLNASVGRRAIRQRKRAEARPPLVSDYPTGREPFLGVMTLGPNGAASSEAGVLQFPLRGHLLTVAPTRTGKGTCHIVPNLLLYGGSALVIDVKGENYAITARRRRDLFPGSQVFRFAPLEEDSAAYNPLDFIRTNDGSSNAHTYDDARLVSTMLLPAKSREDYWDLEARNLLTVLLMYVAIRYHRADKDRTMRSVMALLAPPAQSDGEDAHGLNRSIKTIVSDARTLDEPVMLSLASSFLEHDSRLFSNIASSCRSGMMIWYSPNLLKATERSDFTFSELKSSMCRPLDQDPAPTTLYIVIPPHNLKEYRGIVRMMVGLAIAELTRSSDWDAIPGWRAKPPCDVLFLLDELPILGYMGPIVDGLSYLAGYGIQIWSFVQNIGQLKEIYSEEWHNFTANAGAMSFFGVNDPDTADYVARLLGETSEYMDYYETYSSSTSSSSSSSIGGSLMMDSSYSDSDGSSDTTTQNVRFVREAIAKSAEIRSIDPDIQFVFIRNTPPIIATKMPYYDFPAFWGLYDEWKGL